MQDENNVKLIQAKAVEMGITAAEVEAQIPAIIKEGGMFNAKVIGGFVKRMTADKSSEEVLSQQASDDFASKGDKYVPIIEKAISQPGVLDTANKILGTDFTPESLGYNPETHSLDADKFANALSNQPIPSAEKVAEASSYIKDALGLDALKADDSASASAAVEPMGQNVNKADSAAAGASEE